MGRWSGKVEGLMVLKESSSEAFFFFQFSRHNIQ